MGWIFDNKNNQYMFWNPFTKSTRGTLQTQQYENLRYNYIKALENPNNIGYHIVTDTWTPPTSNKYDTNQIGVGLDMNTNKQVKKYLEDNKRTKDPYLTDSEVKQFVNDRLLDLENILDKHTKGINLSDTKRIIALGLMYHGYGKYLWEPNGPQTRKLHNALYNGTDQDMINAVVEFYKGRNTERSNSHKKFWDEKD